MRSDPQQMYDDSLRWHYPNQVHTGRSFSTSSQPVPQAPQLTIYEIVWVFYLFPVKIARPLTAISSV